jgi:multiple sugar transport system permease protein
MTPWLYAVGSTLFWIGLISGLTSLYRVTQLFVPPQGVDHRTLIRRAVTPAIIAGVSLMAAGPLLRGHEGGRLFLPVFWPIMPFAAWVAVVAAIGALIKLAQACIGDRHEQPKLLKQAVLLAVTCTLGAALYRYQLLYSHPPDPGNQISLLKGAIPLSAATAGGLVALAIAAILLMGAAGASARSRGWSTVVATHLALVVGSILFGVPFFWLLDTSFKEEVDMASTNGLVWIPKVQETQSYLNPENPALETHYKGEQIQAEIVKRNADGTVEVNVTRPAGLAGDSFTAPLTSFKEVPTDDGVVTATYEKQPVTAIVIDELGSGLARLRIIAPGGLVGTEFNALPADTTPVRHVGLKWDNYSRALEFLPTEADHGLTYLRNTLYLVILSVVGTLLSSSLVAYAFSRMRFPGRDQLFWILLSTMMLPAAVTMLPQFLIFRSLGWIDTLRPLWVPAFLGSAFNVFLLRQFLLGIPMELEDAAKIDGCSYLKTYWSVMLPQITPALAVIGIWTFMGAWNNFMGPLIYVSSPENMPISYALQMYHSDRGGEPGMLMAFTTMSMLPVLALFFFAQRYFIEGVTLSGLGGR